MEIIIGKLIVDNSELNDAMVSSKKAILDLENEQKKLKKETDSLSSANEEQLKTFIDNENELKKLKSEYSSNQKSVLALTKAQTGLDDSLRENVRTQDEAIANTKELIAARRQIDTTTLEGAQAIAEINAKIGENNDLIAANSSTLEQQKINVGNYSDSIREAANNLNPLNGGLLGFLSRAKDAGGAGNLVKDSLGGMAQGFLGAAKAGILFIATPIGLFLLSLAVVFTSVKAAMDRSEESTAKITKIFAVFGGVLNVFLKILSKLGDYWINSYVKILDRVADATDNALGGISKGLRLLGFKEAAKDLDTFVVSTKASIKGSQDLAAANLQLEKSQRKARLTQLQYQKEAEQFRQIRDDENKSIKERITANDQLGLTLKKQLKDELTIAQLALKVSNLRISQEGKTGAALDAQAEALTQIADIQERLTGQESEQLVNRVSLQKEAAAKAKEYSDQNNAQSLTRLEVLKLENEQRALSTEQRITEAERIFKTENDFAKKTLSGGDLQKKLIENRQTLSSSILAITEEQVSKELDAQKKGFEETKATTLELFNSQKQSAEDLAKAQTLLLNKKLLSEKDLAAETLVIENAKNESLAVINTNFAEAEKVRKENEAANTLALEAVAFEIRLQDIQDRDASEQEIKQALLSAQYDQELILLEKSLSDKVISQGVYDQKLLLAGKKFDSQTKKNDQILNKQKRDETERTVAHGLNALGSLFEGSKAIAVASALFNTYQGITAELSTKAITPYEIGLKVANVAFVAAAGFAAVKNILKTDKSGGGGAASSSTPSTTSGTRSFVNTAQTETVARVSDTPQQQNTVVSPPILILETLQEATANLAVKITSG
jgi:hypothetical protein